MEPRQQLAALTHIPRHRHAQAYAAVVLQGGYREAGDGGRWHAQPGDVLFHSPFTSHMDCVSGRRTAILNLPLPMNAVAMPHHRVKDADLLVRVAERDVIEASHLLLEQLLPGGAPAEEPVDTLAAKLASHDAPSISAWSNAAGVRRETLFRWFQSAYGVSPTRYRVEARARFAWREIAHGTKPFAEIASMAGFADQSHMSRAVRALTGRPPAYWRMQHSFKTSSR